MALEISHVPNQRMFCPSCNEKAVKNGFQNGKQRYRCKSCNKNFQHSYSYKAYYLETNDTIKQLLCEGVGVLGISRLLKISKNTVLARMLRIASAIKKPTWSRPYCTFQIDELWTYVKRKGQFTYITYCLEEETGTVLDFSIGQRSYKTIAPMVNKLLGNHPKRIYTDRLAIYPKLIPNRVHKVFKYATNKIERNNLNLRLRIKRLARKTICFSKSEKYLRAHLMIYFWGNKPIV